MPPPASRSVSREEEEEDRSFHRYNTHNIAVPSPPPLLRPSLDPPARPTAAVLQYLLPLLRFSKDLRTVQRPRLAADLGENFPAEEKTGIECKWIPKGERDGSYEREMMSMIPIGALYNQ